MRDLSKTKEIVFLLLFPVCIVAQVSFTDVNLTSDTLYQNALKKYPILLSDDYTTSYAKDYRRFSNEPWHKDFEDNASKYYLWYRQLMTFAHDTAYHIKVGKFEDKVRTCWMIATTYTGAMHDLRRHFEVRYLYLNTLDYEVGYMTHEIISKYQRMLEIFYLVRKKYFYSRHKHIAPVKWVLYMYTNVLEMSHVIIHSCNMLHELKKKYAVDGKETMFDDYHLEKPMKYHKNASRDRLESMQLLLNERNKFKKEKKRALQKWRKKHKIRLPWTVKPSQGKWPWPLVYGWSIEDW